MKVLIGFVCAAVVMAGTIAQGATDIVFSKAPVRARATWIKGPVLSPQESMLRLEWLSNVDGSPVEAPGLFKVILWMPDMGHGSSPTQLLREMDSQNRPLMGVYRVINMFFVMSGVWEIRVQLKTGSGDETKSFQVNLAD